MSRYKASGPTAEICRRRRSMGAVKPVLAVTKEEPKALRLSKLCVVAEFTSPKKLMASLCIVNER